MIKRSLSAAGPSCGSCAAQPWPGRAHQAISPAAGQQQTAMIKHDHKRVVRGLHAEALGEVGVLAAVRSGHGAPPEDSASHAQPAPRLRPIAGRMRSRQPMRRSVARACAAGSCRRLAELRIGSATVGRRGVHRACPGWASPGTACAAGAPAHLSACSSAPQACSRAGSRAVFRLRLPCRDAAAEPDGSAPQARARSPAGYAVLRRRLAIQTSAPRHACRRRRRRRGASPLLCACVTTHTSHPLGAGPASAQRRRRPG